MRCLITGSHGFVGRRLTRRLLDVGWFVKGVDDRSTGLPEEKWGFQPKSWNNFVDLHADIRNFMRRASPVDYDLIIHCAAIVGGRQTIEGDPLRVATDLSIDAEFFAWLAHHRPKCRVIYFSSSAVYGTRWQGKAKTRLRENFTDFSYVAQDGIVDVPDFTYGWSKLTGELLAQYAVTHYGLDVVIYRPFSGYGEDQDICYPFPAIVQRVLNHEDPITVWGSGDQCRDFIYIEDVISAVLATYDKLAPGEILNLGTGVATSFRQLVEIACEVMGLDRERLADVILDKTKPEGVFWRVCDPMRLNKFYAPTTTLQEGIERTAAYLTQRKS